ncbi:hypothetical protein Bca52824_018122 [Brassica carinata]|uniref:Uncharacterized protein n=1 Tax=Brassica carinata TaxID=52824 RepID=A0A8X7VQA8_BRACI|nr:hypothetical protein Bca52824_018122 [Brassica carinata]
MEYDIWFLLRPRHPLGKELRSSCHRFLGFVVMLFKLLFVHSRMEFQEASELLTCGAKEALVNPQITAPSEKKEMKRPLSVAGSLDELVRFGSPVSTIAVVHTQNFPMETTSNPIPNHQVPSQAPMTMRKRDAALPWKAEWVCLSDSDLNAMCSNGWPRADIFLSLLRNQRLPSSRAFLECPHDSQERNIAKL